MRSQPLPKKTKTKPRATDKTEETTAEENEETTAEETEPEKEKVDESLFAYYDLLSEEYEKSGKLYAYNYDWAYATLPEKIIIKEWNYPNPSIIKVYDVNQKSFVSEFEGIWEIYNNSIYYADVDNGYIYCQSDKELQKRDLSGNVIAALKYNPNEEIQNLFADGTMFYKAYSQDKGKYCYYMYSSDWKTKTELPLLQADGEHGLKVDIPYYDVLAKYKNKVYVYNSSNSNGKEFVGYYCLDTDAGTWERVDSGLQDFDPSAYNTTVGKYWIMGGSRSNINSKIYDMETDTFIAEINTQDFCSIYKGGKNHLGLSLSEDRSCFELCRGRCPSDASDYVVDEIVLKMDAYDYGSYYPVAINEQYYLYGDKYGFFLREYGKGEDGEITVYLFDN